MQLVQTLQVLQTCDGSSFIVVEDNSQLPIAKGDMKIDASLPLQPANQLFVSFFKNNDFCSLNHISVSQAIKDILLMKDKEKNVNNGQDIIRFCETNPDERMTGSMKRTLKSRLVKHMVEKHNNY